MAVSGPRFWRGGNCVAHYSTWELWQDINVLLLHSRHGRGLGSPMGWVGSAILLQTGLGWVGSGSVRQWVFLVYGPPTGRTSLRASLITVQLNIAICIVVICCTSFIVCHLCSVENICSVAAWQCLFIDRFGWDMIVRMSVRWGWVGLPEWWIGLGRVVKKWTHDHVGCTHFHEMFWSCIYSYLHCVSKKDITQPPTIISTIVVWIQ